ncbi:hypothetical protein [Algoriphagus halophilus]|uniref:DUF998 domain-containing protein n=1 Tax=Algoriphagus halophilus TaxID=226505 RepID=A0A1N6D3E1_9BACT|nr:hypothetical protein [Algoriphagus halophilus]SIN65350.1 hypothetical protein SAMN05444394_0122 [Algoriphagus halophilus]
MKLAKALWSLGSFLVNGTIIVYIFLSSKAPANLEERFAYINENWGIYNAHWKIEFLLMTMVAIGAFYFAIKSKKISWSLITIGQLVLLMIYPLMLGGYHNNPIDLAKMINQIATIIFVFGNIIFLSGLFVLYIKDNILKPWLRYTAVAFASIEVLVLLFVFADVLTWQQTMVTAPLVNVLYLINAYYGLKLKME